MYGVKTKIKNPKRHLQCNSIYAALRATFYVPNPTKPNQTKPNLTYPSGEISQNYGNYLQPSMEIMGTNPAVKVLGQGGVLGWVGLGWAGLVWVNRK